MINIYKPNKSNTGHYFQFNIGKNNSKNKKSSPYALYVRAIKQFSWSNGKGSFKENGDKSDKSISIKFNEFEAAAMLNGFENFFSHYPQNDKKQNELTFFHASDTDKTSISLVTAIAKNGNKGVFFGIIRNGIRFFIPLTIGECTLVAEYCRFFVNKSFEESFRKMQEASFQKRVNEKTEVKKSEAPSILDPEANDEADNIFQEGNSTDDQDPFDKKSPF